MPMTRQEGMGTKTLFEHKKKRVFTHRVVKHCQTFLREAMETIVGDIQNLTVQYKQLAQGALRTMDWVIP